MTGVTPSSVSLRIHKTKQHKKVLGFKCQRCEFEAKFSSNLCRHRRQSHEHQRFPCEHIAKKEKLKHGLPEGWWLITLLQQGAELVDGLPEGKCQQLVLRNYLTYFYYSINV